MSNSHELGKNVRDRVRDRVRASVGDSVWSSVGDSVWDRVVDSVVDSVRESAGRGVWMVVNDGLKLFLSLENKSNGKEN